MREQVRRRLGSIQESIALIEERTRQGRTAFLRDVITRDAVLLRLQVLAKTTARLQDSLKAHHPEISWERICDVPRPLRDGSEAQVAEVAWDIVATHLPRLKAVVEQELKSAVGDPRMTDTAPGGPTLVELRTKREEILRMAGAFALSRVNPRIAVARPRRSALPTIRSRALKHQRQHQ